MLAGKRTLQLDEVMRSLKESQQMMGGDKSSEDNQILVTKGEQGKKKYGGQHGRSFQSREMSAVKCHYCEELGHIQFKCPIFMEDLRSLKEKGEKLKSAPSANVVSYENDLLLCEDEADDKVKKCETLDEGRICCAKVGTHPSPTSSSVKNEEVESYYEYEELV